MLALQNQLELFGKSAHKWKKHSYKEWGTFKDNLRAPIHRWFTYPAGFSYKAVETCIKSYGIKPGHVVYDPFMGTGTTNLTAKIMGIDSFGIEAHPFVFPIAKGKLNTEICLQRINQLADSLQEQFASIKIPTKGIRDKLEAEFPELVLKCYNTDTLYQLLVIRNTVSQLDVPAAVRSFLNVALTSLLREVSSVQTGWPYIAPNKSKNSSKAINAFETYTAKLYSMIEDVSTMRRKMEGRKSKHRIYKSDSKNTEKYYEPESVDFVFTSPPYLNNFDYADRTRLEMYFFGEALTWSDITTKVRTKLMTCATTQISRLDSKYDLDVRLKDVCPDVYEFLLKSKNQLEELRKVKGGKKSYDLMVSGYFNDIHLVLRDVYRVMKKNSYAIFVLGDSAPYGVHIPTDDLIGQLGVAIGFDNYHKVELRTRGGKWKDNPQRHKVALRESIVTLEKKS
jgi:DNA modification methylase